MGKQVQKKTGPRTYCQYANTNELKSKLAAETIIAAFTVRTSGGRSVICIAHGHERKTGVTNVMEMAIKTDKLIEKIMGFHYFQIEPDWDAQMVDVKSSEVEEMISTSCLLLPVVIEVGPTKQCMYVVVHDDRSVTNTAVSLVHFSPNVYLK